MGDESQKILRITQNGFKVPKLEIYTVYLSCKNRYSSQQKKLGRGCNFPQLCEKILCHYSPSTSEATVESQEMFQTEEKQS